MADRVTVTEPVTGEQIEVDSDSQQAKTWGESGTSKTSAKKSASSKSDKK